MTRRHLEDDLQKAVAKVLDRLGWLWAHPPNGGKRNDREAARLKAQGVKPGIPDIMIFEEWMARAEPVANGPRGKPSGFGMGIELKIGKVKPTDNQLEWAAALSLRGWRCSVCRSMDDVLDELQWVMAYNRRESPRRR